MRKMASIRKIDNIVPIAGADAIECAVIGGWSVVVKKDEFKIGDLAVYCEIDSWIPTELAPFLSKGKEPRVYNGVSGERLKTVRLRGQISQGLLLSRFVVLDKIGEIFEGQDVSEILGIQKWEAEIPAQLAGVTKGLFPSFIQKTDQERVQNLVEVIAETARTHHRFEVTEKLEGSSMTVFMRDGEFGVCSRNLELKFSESNAFWAAAIKYDIENKMRLIGLNDIAIQGELIGPGIQGNIYNLTTPEFHVFDVYNIREGEYLTPQLRRDIVAMLQLKHVPVIMSDVMLPSGNVQDILAMAEGKSMLNDKQEREGIVFKSVIGGITFKAISNRYLISQS
jgi:RNA ligase (TIGR02306 family)